MSDDLHDLSAAQLVEGFRARTFSPVDAAKASLARIAALEPTLNAWQVVDEERALAQARASEARWAKGRPAGLLDGVPTAIKDVTETKGWPTLNGSLALVPDGTQDVDAISVERLKAHGAVLVGKTATPEFAWKGVTDSDLKGITRNPWNPALTPGGSSGGSAAAVASGMVALATGTDSGGSIREPASFCNIVGFKPTFGRVPVWPPSPLMFLEHCGPLARTVRDAALMTQAMAGFDPRDGYALNEPAPDLLWRLELGVAGLRVAFSADLGFTPTQPAIAAHARAAAMGFKALGATVEEVQLDIGRPSGASNALYDPLAEFMLRGLGPRRDKVTAPALLESAERGRRLDAVAMVEAEALRRDMIATLAQLHARHDLLVTPTVCVPPFEAGRSSPPDWDESSADSWMALTFPFDMTGQPAISVPCGFTADGRPIGLQIVGPRGADALVLRAARAFEKAHPFGDRRPPA